MRNHSILKPILYIVLLLFAITIPVRAAWPTPDISSRIVKNSHAFMAPFAAPIAVEDEYTVTEGDIVEVVQVNGVLVNDSDPDMDALFAELVTGPAHNNGIFGLNVDGTFVYQHDGSEDDEDSFTYWVTDSTEYSMPVTVKIAVLAVNDAPVLGDLSAGSVSFTENTSPVELFPGISISDNDNTHLVSATIQISSGIQTSDVLAYNNLGTGISGSYDGTGTLLLSGNETVNNYQAVLRTLTFANSGENPTNTTRTVTVSVSDGDIVNPNSNTLNKSVLVNPVNDPPALANLEVSPLNYNEGSGPVQITGSLTVGDVDHTTLSYATVSVSSNYQNGEDVLSFTDALGLTGSWNSAGGTLTLSGGASVENYQAALRTVMYENTSLTPLTSSRTITFSVHDGITPGNSLIRTIEISSQNAAPVLNNIGPAVNYTEDAASVQLTSTLTVEDNDNTNLQSATVSITGNFQMNEDVLTFTPSGGISGSYDAATGILTFTNASSLTNYRTILRSVRFSNSSQNSVNNSRTIAFVVNDGSAGSLPANKNVNIIPINDPPVLAGIEGTSIAYNEGDGAVQITNTITVSDDDNSTMPSAIISIITNYQNDQDVLSYPGGNGLTGVWSSATGQMTLSGTATLSQMQTALRAIRYTNTSTNPNTNERTIRFVVNDGSTNSNTVSRNITIGSTNTAPVISDPSNTPVAFAEGDAPVRLTNTLVIADNDNTTLISATVSISSGFIGTEDVLSFSAVSGITGNYSNTTGVLSFSGTSSLANYQTLLRSVRYANTSENPSTTNRVVSFAVNDGISASNQLTKTATIAGVNDPPVLAGIEGSSLTYNEGDGAVQITNTITVNDIDNSSLPSAIISIITNYQSDQDVLSYPGGNGLTGVWSSATGQITLSGTATLAQMQTALRAIRYTNTSANPNTTTRTVRFVVSDGTNNSNLITRNITLGNVNTPPVLTDPSNTPVAYVEGDAPVRLTNSIVIADDDNTTLSTATITITTGFVGTEDVLSFTAVSGITGNYNNTTGVLSFSGISSLANYQTALRSVRYANTSEDPGATNRVVTFAVNDGTTASNLLTKTVTVTGVNDPPVASALAITASNNRIGTLNTATFTFTDPENDEEGSHSYQWYRSDFSTGLSAIAISGATGSTYRPVKADGGKYIAFEVTPVDEHGLSGTLVRMASFRYINAVPVATNVRVYAPVAEPGEIIRGRFAYSDKEGDARGNAVYTWYRSSVSNPTAASPGTVVPANDSTYLLKSADANKYIWFKVKPVATSGSTPGDSVWSNVLGPIGQYSANITGTDTVCAGAEMKIIITVTAGLAPYEARLQRTGILPKDTIISGIPEASPGIIVKIPGTYRLVKVTDANNDEADVSGSTPVVLYVSPKSRAVISGSTSICTGVDTHAPLTLTFTGGTAPWNVTIRRRETPPFNDTTINNINTSIYNFSARIIGAGPTRHRVIAITDQNGCAGDTTSGSAWLSYKFSPIATITGSDSICPGELARITVTLTAGLPDWSFTYERNGGNPVTIAGISTPSRTFTVTQTGRYSLVDVKDATNQSGCGSGEVLIAYNSLPTAAISGSATICEHTTTNLSVALTGSAPWKFYYTRNMGDSVVVENVSTSPRTVPVTLGGNYTLYAVSDRNKCGGTVSGTAAVTVTSAPEVTISGLKQVYNRTEDDIDTIVGTPVGGIYDGPGVVGNYFIPVIAPIGTHNITYAYRVSPASCYGYDTAVVSVLDNEAIINIEKNRTKYCTNDAPFLITGINPFNVEGFFTITGGVGIQPYGRNTALVSPSALQARRYTITYTYMSGGTIFPKDIEIEIGNQPVASFTWATECFHAEQPIDFTDKSSASFGYFTDTSYFWKIYTPTGYDEDSLQNITYTFAEEGRYSIELQVQNSNGCRDTALTLFNLRPTFKLNEVYYEDFEDNPISWDSGKEKNSVNSWRMETPVRHGSPLHGFPYAHSGEKSWFTYINSYPAPTEKSWITSPCFDFTGIERPMLTLWMWRLFNSNRDGANLKASADSGKTWTLVGEIGDGINWYNSYSILGQPDGTPVGWSNDNGTSNDNNWVRARHSLDFLKGEKEVQFRIFYGSAVSAQNNDGIAIDDFMISARDKMALIEHFTNSNLDKAEKADSILDAMVEIYGGNVVDLQYHTSSPAGDPFYNHNQSVPKARQIYYGMSVVPLAILDGSTDSKHLFDYASKPLDKNAIIVESLEDNLFDIRLEASINNHNLNTEAQIWAKDDVSPTDMSVRIVVVERIIDEVVGNNGDTVFRNVVKAMLPGPGGQTLFNTGWTKGQDRRFEGSWELENVYNENQLRIVAFIQNDLTREVYQVAYTDSINFNVGYEPPFPADNKKLTYYVYPNPVRQFATVQFGETLVEDIAVQLFNNTGKLVYSGIIQRGISSEQIPVENLPDGLYLLRLANDHKLLGVSKLMISK